MALGDVLSINKLKNIMNEIEPQYFREFRSDFRVFKEDIDKKIDSSINELAIIIYETVALKEDLKDMATKDDIKDIWDNMATKQDVKEIWDNMATKDDIKEIKEEMATKLDIDKVHKVIGSYEVRSRNIENILLEDHKPRIIDLEKTIYR